MGGCASRPREHDANPPAEVPFSAELPGKSGAEAAVTTCAAPAPEEVKAEAAADVAAENGPEKECLSDIMAATASEPSDQVHNVSAGDEPKPDPQPIAGPAENIVEGRELADHGNQTAEEAPVAVEGTQDPRVPEPESPEQEPVVSENGEEGASSAADEGDVAEASKESQNAATPQAGTTAGDPPVMEDSPAVVLGDCSINIEHREPALHEEE